MTFFTDAFFVDTIFQLEELPAESLIDGRLYGVRNVTDDTAQDPSWYMYFVDSGASASPPEVIVASFGDSNGRFLALGQAIAGSGGGGGGGGVQILNRDTDGLPGQDAITPANGAGTIAIVYDNGFELGNFYSGSAMFLATGSGPFDWQALSGSYTDGTAADPGTAGVNDGMFSGQIYTSVSVGTVVQYVWDGSLGSWISL